MNFRLVLGESPYVCHKRVTLKPYEIKVLDAVFAMGEARLRKWQKRPDGLSTSGR